MLPCAVAQAVKEVAGRSKVIGLEKVEILAELMSGNVSELETTRVVYRVDFLQGNKTAQVIISPQWRVLGEAKWRAVGAGDDDDDDEDDDDDDD